MPKTFVYNRQLMKIKKNTKIRNQKQLIGSGAEFETKIVQL